MPAPARGHPAATLPPERVRGDKATRDAGGASPVPSPRVGQAWGRCQPRVPAAGARRRGCCRGAARCAGRSCCPGLAAPAGLPRRLAVRPRSRGSRNEMEQQKDGEIRLPALPQQIKRWD